MNLDLQDKVAVICAASQGVGKGVALALAKEGVKIAICARGKEKLQQAADEIAQETQSHVLAIAADMTSESEIENFLTQVVETFGGIDILVNNAGGPPAGKFLELESRAWEHAFRLTLLSTVRCIEGVLPSMRKRGGRIINLVSTSVKEPIENLMLSNAIRPGVVGLAKTLSRELGEYNITVNNISLGRILTDRFHRLAEKRAQEQGRSLEQITTELIQEIPLGRLGTPKDVGDLAVFLASKAAAYVTGVTVQIDGGLIRSV